jgi:hypothetical protein
MDRIEPPEVVFHRFRQCFATIFHREEVNIEFIAAFAGWDDPGYMNEENPDPLLRGL